MTEQTRTIAGRHVTLAKGQRYVAMRPMLSSRQGKAAMPVTIYELHEDGSEGQAVTTLVMPYDDANQFLREFNCTGPTSFDGRLW
jgi:hypothetical protein